MLGLICALTLILSQPAFSQAAMKRPQGPCDIYAAAGDPCVAAHSTTRALYASYSGPLYQLLRQSDGKSLNIGVVPASSSDTGGYANANAQDSFCANTICWIAKIYDQSPKHNDLFQAPRGAFSGPAMGGFNNLPLADMAPVTVMGHKVYGVFIAPGMGLRRNDPKGTAVDDQAQGQYWVINGLHFNSGCCFDYGNAEIDSKDDGNGTMETTYYGNSTGWYHGAAPGPWVMTDQENNLVGCVNKAGASKLCAGLPSISWRFVTGMAKGEPHHWASLGGDAQRGSLQVMFDGPRVDVTYDPMRKQGAILLGNGGDNSNASQGTFYEGAMTAGGTFPTDATDQTVQANVVAAGYRTAHLAMARAGSVPTGLQTFAPGSSQDIVVTFTNSSAAPATGVRLSLSVPKGWTVSPAPRFESVSPGGSVSTTFKVTSDAAAFNGDMIASASWTENGKPQTEKLAARARNVSPIKINEFRVSDGSANTTNSFIELYNAGGGEADISNWSLTQHQAQQAISSAVKIPGGTKLAAHGFYLLGLANSGLTVPAQPGNTTIYVRSTDGMQVGGTLTIGTGANAETRKIVALSSAAGSETTLWQPAEDPMITIPAGSTNVPVANIDGFAVGQKIALGHGASYPAVSRGTEKYELATVTAVGKPGTQAFLAADAAAGATNISVSSVANITAGDKIRLDIESRGHGIETVTVKTVGTAAIRDALAADVRAGATSIQVRPGFGVFNNAGANGANLAAGERLIVGMPDKQEIVTIAAVNGANVEIRPALARDHLSGEPAVDPGTGLALVAPLKFSHAGNLPFSARGTGISFLPATSFAHSSNEPVVPLGGGIALDKPLAKAHAADDPVRDQAVTTAGYQDAKAPDQWFGGPALATAAGTMVLRDAAGHVADSLNYGLLVDPWASEGDQSVSGAGQSGCRAPAAGIGRPVGRGPFPILTNSSTGRQTDGGDSDSNCMDFVASPAAILPQGAVAGTTNIKVSSVADFRTGQQVMIDTGANRETAVIATVGTAGATTTATALNAGATTIPVSSLNGFSVGQTITIDSDANSETATIAAINGGRNGPALAVTAPLAHPHASGAPIAGSGITLGGALTKPHAAGAQLLTDLPTPGAPNKYSK
jgi:hypothetical protein